MLLASPDNIIVATSGEEELQLCAEQQKTELKATSSLGFTFFDATLMSLYVCVCVCVCVRGSVRRRLRCPISRGKQNETERARHHGRESR